MQKDKNLKSRKEKTTETKEEETGKLIIGHVCYNWHGALDDPNYMCYIVGHRAVAHQPLQGEIVEKINITHKDGFHAVIYFEGGEFTHQYNINSYSYIKSGKDNKRSSRQSISEQFKRN